MNYLGLDTVVLKNLGALDTAAEIEGQPALWMNIFNKVLDQKLEIETFLNTVLPKVKKIVFTGAGTSAYIGLSLQGLYKERFGITSVEVPTTDFITHPTHYLGKDEPILLISFARSGNSPESLAAVKIADKQSKNCYHIIITCDVNGSLAQYQSASSKFVLVLPEESNDKSLAMTGSYSGMLLAGILVANILELNSWHNKIEILCNYGKRMLENYANEIAKIADLNFKRAVFLGSGPLFGTATESHLKLQELTDGGVICKNESFLGLRHGPKAVVNEETIVVNIFSNNEYVQQYERDLVHAMNVGKKPLCQIGISELPVQGTNFDLEIILSANGNQLSEELLTVCSIIPGQLLGFFKSLQLGLKPDAPSVSGAINRVVQGVNIYNF